MSFSSVVFLTQTRSDPEKGTPRSDRGASRDTPDPARHSDQDAHARGRLDNATREERGDTLAACRVGPAAAQDHQVKTEDIGVNHGLCEQ